MPSQLQGFVAGLRRALAGFTAGQKAVSAIAVVAVVVGGLALTSWAAKPSLVPLYTDLEPSDAGAITERLDGEGTTYQLSDGGRTIMVPKDDVYPTRLAMSAANLPSGGSQGYALLDEQGITTSEFRQRVDFQRALEGELTRTVGAIDGVQAAKVHLVIPEDDLFSDDESQPTASVLLRTAPGESVAPGQVRSIVHLVSSSVEGLAPENVTVADQTGRMLAAPGEEGLTAAASDARTEQTSAFEQQLATSVERLLEPVTGAGGAVVRVKADLDFDQRSSRSERYEPVEGLPPVNETTSRETYTGAGQPGATGVLGPDGLPVVAEGTDTNYEMEQAQRSNALNTVTEEVRTAPGQVRRMSVAVLLDGNAGGTVDEAAVRDLVEAATLLDGERGDTLEVSTMAFDTTAAKEAEKALSAAEEQARRRELFSLAKTVAVVVVVLIVLLLAYRSSRKQRREAVSLADLPVLPPADDVLDLDSEERFVNQPPAAIPAPSGRQLEVQSEVADLVDRQPEEVAQLLRGWLADRREG